MARIADDVISYEHTAPLVHAGVDAVRDVCQQGFDAMPDEFRWDIPDLHVIVRDDIAVTWGLNSMRGRTPDGQVIESYSRGTRILQRTDGTWRMIHQHVSYPFDPATGQARTDLTPADQQPA
jgi:ketosteroid isomerase-like protein